MLSTSVVKLALGTKRMIALACFIYEPRTAIACVFDFLKCKYVFI